MEPNDRVAVVTGGSSGIGAAIVTELKRVGARPVTWDIVDGTGIYCDVSDATSVASAMEQTVRTVGSPTIMVASAGIDAYARLVDIEAEAWDQVLAVNLRGVMLCMQAAAREMIRSGGGGSIVAVSSVNSAIADPGLAAYSCSKAGVNMLVKIAARELGPHGIRVNAVGPGPTRTPMLEPLLSPEYLEDVARRTPLGEIGDPPLVAQAVAHLLQMEWVTGQILMVDGGSSLSTGKSNAAEVAEAGKHRAPGGRARESRQPHGEL